MDYQTDHDRDEVVLELVPLREKEMALEAYPVADQCAEAFDKRWRQAERHIGEWVKARK